MLWQIILPDHGLYNAYHVDGCHFASALDWELAMSRAQQAAAEHEARLRGYLVRRGLLAAAAGGAGGDVQCGEEAA